MPVKFLAVLESDYGIAEIYAGDKFFVSDLLKNLSKFHICCNVNIDILNVTMYVTAVKRKQKE